MLKGKTAVITGASRGIGAATAYRLASLGADIAVIYAGNENAAKAVCAKCSKDYGVSAKAYKCDVGDNEMVKETVSKIKSDFGTVHILVNNAGITKDGLLIRMSEQDFSDVIDVNLKGTFNCIRFASRYMMKQRCGRIINLSSVVGVSGNAGQINYAASKAGVIGMTKSAAKELAGRGITVNAVAPGFIETDMTEILSEKVKEGMKQQIPLGSFGKAEDVAGTIAFLASEEARYITGQVLHVDGGMVM